MSTTVKKTVKIKENALIDLIDNLVTEAVEVQKKEWISEQAKINSDKTTILENKIKSLEEKFKTLLENKK